jgi:hypothetical protein
VEDQILLAPHVQADNTVCTVTLQLYLEVCGSTGELRCCDVRIVDWVPRWSDTQKFD